MFHWFPGHMAKALNQIKEMQQVVDLFIVVLDARAPLSSYNAEFDKIAPNKPRLFVITKKDLADISKLEGINNKFNNERDAVVVVSLKKKADINKITKAATKLLETKAERDRAKGLIKPRLRAAVVGVPNSGKSTLINALAKKSATKVGNTPGVTKGKQWVKAGDIQLLDTPGILWPKFDDELTSIKLAIIGSIKITHVNIMEVFYAAYKLISTYYPRMLINMNLEPQFEEEKMYNQLHNIAMNNNLLLPGKKPNLEKAARYFVNFSRDLKGVTYD